jgi:hypothetical protein
MGPPRESKLRGSDSRRPLARCPGSDDERGSLSLAPAHCGRQPALGPFCDAARLAARCFSFEQSGLVALSALGLPGPFCASTCGTWVQCKRQPPVRSAAAPAWSSAWLEQDRQAGCTGLHGAAACGPAGAAATPHLLPGRAGAHVWRRCAGALGAAGCARAGPASWGGVRLAAGCAPWRPRSAAPLGGLHGAGAAVGPAGQPPAAGCSRRRLGVARCPLPRKLGGARAASLPMLAQCWVGQPASCPKVRASCAFPRPTRSWDSIVSDAPTHARVPPSRRAPLLLHATATAIAITPPPRHPAPPSHRHGKAFTGRVPRGGTGATQRPGSSACASPRQSDDPCRPASFK